MSAQDSIQSSNDTSTENTALPPATADTVPTGKADRPVKLVHSLFVPLVTLIVFAIVIVASYRGNESSRLITTADHGEIPAHPASPVHPTAAVSTDKSIDPPEANTVSMPATAFSEAPVSLDQPTEPESVPVTEPPVSVEVVSTTTAQPPLVTSRPLADEPQPLAQQARQQTVPISSTADQALTGYDGRLESWRRSYLLAQQARRIHRLKMHEYRAVVEKRIEQDRRDMHRRRQQNKRLERFEQNPKDRPYDPI
ncbi:MAG: hypothetical protein JSW45_03645 [Thiotrichales bacterium]|nr:MAG: hypothetical protein JSW45_03645 [Thiotrichales bacterium]